MEHENNDILLIKPQLVGVESVSGDYGRTLSFDYNFRILLAHSKQHFNSLLTLEYNTDAPKIYT